MLDFLLPLVHVLILAVVAFALVAPAWRLRAAALLGLAAVGALAWGATSGARSLEITHRFSAFEGRVMTWKAFPIETVEAPGLHWGLAVAAFGVLWAGLLWWKRPHADRPSSTALGAGFHPFWAPMLLAWTGMALHFALEKTAAPAAMVDPAGVERALLPASLAAAALLAISLRKVFWSLCWLSLFVAVARLPLAAWGTYATYNELGTSYDVHSITVFANPLQQIAQKVVAGSNEQLGWLIWAPNLLVLPGLYLMSLSGVAFAIVMFVLHPKTQEGTATR